MKTVVLAAMMVLAPLGVPFPLLQAESPEPRNVPGPVGPLSVVADIESGNVVLEWSGGTPPFAVVRADHQCFGDADHMSVLAADLTARSFVDSGALHLGTQMYYQVYDANSVPEAHRLSPDGGLPGQEITVRGAGFDPDCSRNSVYIAGSTAHVVDCSFIHLVFEIPEESITGIVMVGTPRGIVLVGDPCTDLSRKTATWNADEPKRSEGVFDLLFELRLPENHETPKVLRGWKKMARIDIHVDLDRGLVSPTNHPKEWGLRVVRDPAQPRPELWVSQYRLLSSMSFTLEEAGRPTGTLKVDESAVPALLAQGNAIRATVICSALPVIGSTSSSR